MEFDIDCASEYIYTKEDVMCFHHSHSRHFLTFFLVSCSLCLWSVMSQGQWLVKYGGKKVQTPSLGLKISIPKFDNSNLIAEYSKIMIGRCMNPSKQVMKALLYHLPKIWNVDERVVGADLGLGRFQFDFDQEDDIVEVMKNEPFHFDN